jgi:hypothetical protein
MADPERRGSSEANLTRAYVLVLLVEAIVIAALYFVGRAFA